MALILANNVIQYVLNVVINSVYSYYHDVYSVVYSVICSYANRMLVIYNLQCKDDERIFFNITHQDIEPKNCTGAGGELVYVSTIINESP